MLGAPNARQRSLSNNRIGMVDSNPKRRFMVQCREVMRFKRLALRTEQASGD